MSLKRNPADAMQQWPVDKLQAFPRNSRVHTPAQISQIAASIMEFGFAVPVLAQADGTIIAGHARVLAARQIGIESVPVMVADGWSDAQVRAYVIADNKLALNSAWDDEILAVELDALRDLKFDMSLMGFEAQELNDLIGTPNTGVDPDEVPPVPVVPVSRAGDIWVMGAHRVMAGDCRDPAQVALLLNGRTLNLAVTSPPYAEQRDYDASSGFRPIPPAEYVEWFAAVSANVAAALAPDGSWFINIKPPGVGLDTDLYVFDLVIAHVRAWGWHFATEFCWERNGVPKSVTRRFKNQFEPVYQFTRGEWKMRPDAVRHASEHVPLPFGKGAGNTGWKNAQGNGGVMPKRRKGGKGVETGGAASDSQCLQDPFVGRVIVDGLAYPGNRLPTLSGSHEATGHAAAFPVGLPEFFINAYTDEGDAVFDPFVGSGSSLMACERTGRAGFGMDLSPSYCDVSVFRWQAYTGQSAILDGTDQTFEDVKRERSQAKAGTAAPDSGHEPTA